MRLTGRIYGNHADKGVTAMNWEAFACADVRIEYASMAKLNRIRAWARKHNAAVKTQRYARDAYEGTVSIPMRQGRDQQNALVVELKALLKGE